MKRIAVIGAGIIGRLAAWRLSELGSVTLFEKRKESDTGGCSFVGAGLLSPWSELDFSEKQIYTWGVNSLSLWNDYLARFSIPPFFQRKGTLILSHLRDLPDLERLKSRLLDWVPRCEFQGVDSPSIAALEPDLSGRFSEGIFLPNEAQLENRELLFSLRQEIEKKGKVFFQSEIEEVQPHEIKLRGDTLHFDLIVDCRGIGAKSRQKTLRSVRGEIIRVEAPEVNLNRPLRLIHPKYPLYIAPRPNHQFVIGASLIESESLAPVTVRTALELLSAAFSIHSGFAEAKILELGVGLRPTLPDHLPHLDIQPGLAELNGFYRHGFLLAPYFIEKLFQEVK